MANEAILRDRFSNPIDMTCQDANGIEKGAFLQLFDPRIASGAPVGASNFACAGICAREKIANDGRTQVAVFRDGIFDVRASGAISVGAPLGCAENNDVMAIKSLATIASGAQIIGHALETAADAEVFQMWLNIR